MFIINNKLNEKIKWRDC